MDCTINMKNIAEKVFLFDMDGTLTPVRQQIENDVIFSLAKLSKFGKIGVVTGSDFEYVAEQVLPGLVNLDKSRIELLPCNGTKRFLAKDDTYSMVSHVNMIDQLGRDQYNHLLRMCTKLQHDLMQIYFVLPYTGTFLQFRGSLLNWCPIGRSASNVERSEWENFDKKNLARVRYAELLSNEISRHGLDVTVALGGSTSVDIYPTGWDKTYALKHYAESDVYFVGDKCKQGGNDYHIYKKLAKYGKAYETKNTKETCKIIEGLCKQSSSVV